MRRTILLADDSVTIRKIVEITFGESDIHVESVASGQEALERLHELRPDLVLADVVMPGPSGYELCRVIKASDRPVPVLLLAGTFEPFDAEQARACGSDGHLTKPFDSRLLVERVEQLLTRGVSREVAPGEKDDLEAMFDELASTERPGMIDAPPAPVARLDIVAAGASEGGARDETPTPVDDDPFGDKASAESREMEDEMRSATPALSRADLDAIAVLVVERLSERVIREIAWDVVPDLAEILVRERIRQLERDEREPG